MTGIAYSRWEGPIEAAAVPLLALCRRVFADFDEDYLLARLPAATDADLWLAEADGEWMGFKLGYRRGAELLYSWLGGVDPRMRGQGIAGELMDRQHAHAAKAGYRFVETRTRASNNAMILLNLRHGFHVCGFELDAKGIEVVHQRKRLVPG